MWNPTASSSTASSNDNKQNIKEIVGVDDYKCSGVLDQSITITNPTSTFGGQLTDSANIKPQQQKDYLNEETVETIDSGFISGPQISYSTNLDEDNKELNIPESSSEPQDHSKAQQQPNFDSGVIEEDCDDIEFDLEQQKNQYTESDMILPHSVESGISEWFCNLSIRNNTNTDTNSPASNLPAVNNAGLNNLGAPKQQSSVPPTKASYSTSSIEEQQPQQITAVNAWEKYYQQNDEGDTPLHLGCISGYEDVVAALIRIAPHPCLFNIQNDEAQTPLHLATLTAQPKIIRMLLIAGAKPTVRDRHGNTALHLACMSGEEQCVRALTIPISASEVNEAHRQYGHRANDKSYIKYAQLPSDLEIRNYDGERCVHLAAQAGFINILRILVLYGADINAREGKSGRTPLHIAIESCNEELANYLLGDCQKLNLETATYAGLTAYQVACILNKSEMLNILEQKGAEPLTPPDSDYDSSDLETDLDDSKSYDRFGDRRYFVGHKGGSAMTVA